MTSDLQDTGGAGSPKAWPFKGCRHQSVQCIRCERDEMEKELADLRAYKERTEAGLHKLSDIASMHGDILDDEMRDLGLWRDPPQAEVQP